jgi:hypothetical protein
MNSRTFQHDLAKAILRCTNGLQYDDAVELVRFIAPEVQRVVAQREQQITEKALKKKKPESKLNYVKVL